MTMTGAYRRVVLANAQSVGSIESSLRTLSYLLPGRFHNADVVSEAIYSSVGLIGVFHDSILAPEARRQNPHAPISRFNKYTFALLASSSWANSLSIILTVIQAFEVVSEMAALKLGGKKLRSKIIVAIESLKAACRLALLRASGGRMILHSQMPDRDYDPAKLSPVDESEPLSWKGARTRLERPQVNIISGGNDLDRSVKFLLSKALMTPNAPPIELLSRLTGFRKWAEYLFILRPLIYVLAIKRYGLRSYKPWLISFGLELLSFTAALDWRSGRFSPLLTELEKQEAKRRAFLFIYYLLRRPFYDEFTKSRLSFLAASLSKKPVLSILGNIIQDYQPLWETYHFYTSGGSRN